MMPIKLFKETTSVRINSNDKVGVIIMCEKEK